MLKSMMVTFVLVVVCQFNLFAQDKGKVHGLQRDPEEQALYEKMEQAHKKKDWPAYESASKDYIAFSPMYNLGYYNLACAQILQGNSDGAFANLEKSVELGFVDLDHLQSDNDFKAPGIKEDKRWSVIIEKIKENKTKMALKRELYQLFQTGKYELSLSKCSSFTKKYNVSAEIVLLQAQNYGMLKKKAEALKFLEQYADLQENSYVIALQYMPSFKEYVNDAKFKAIQAKIAKKSTEIEKARKKEQETKLKK